MSERGLPELAPGALRDHGTNERVERVWSRLESDLAVAPARHRTVLWWAPAALVIVFGAGVFVGANWRAQDPVAVSLAAEPPSAVERAGGPQLPIRVVPAPLRTEPSAKPERRSIAPQVEPMPVPEQVVAPPELLAVLPAPPPIAAAGPPEWQQLANNGDYAGARAAIDRHGGFDAALAAATPDQLMSLYDVARASGQRARAVQALRLVVERHPGDQNAPIAAFTLGNLLESAGDKAGAAAAFEAHRRLSPKGEFADDALAREFDLAVDRGDLERARQLADQYAKDFPKGRRLGAMRKRLAELTGAAPSENSETDESVEDEADDTLPSGP